MATHMQYKTSRIIDMVVHAVCDVVATTPKYFGVLVQLKFKSINSS